MSYTGQVLNVTRYTEEEYDERGKLIGAAFVDSSAAYENMETNDTKEKTKRRQRMHKAESMTK